MEFLDTLEDEIVEVIGRAMRRGDVSTDDIRDAIRPIVATLQLKVLIFINDRCTDDELKQRLREASPVILSMAQRTE